MTKQTVKFLTVSFIIMFLLFFSFVHSAFRLQMFKHTVSDELEEKLRVETLSMQEEYVRIQSEANMVAERIRTGNQRRSQLVVEQIYGLITTIEKKDGIVDTPEEVESLKKTLTEYYNGTDQGFWILDSESRVILAPQTGSTDVDLGNGEMSAEWIGKGASGPVFLKDGIRKWDNPGYGKQLKAQSWTLVSFQQWGLLENKIDGVESLRKMRAENLISQMGAMGSAGVVDSSLRLKEYTVMQLRDHPVDDIHIESALPVSKLLFNGADGKHEYVLIDPVTGKGKYRHMYVSYDELTRSHYFITRDIRRLFNGIDQRSSPMLMYLGALTAVLMIVNVAVLLWSLYGRMRTGDGE